MFRSVHRYDRIETPSGESIRNAEGRFQLIDPLQLKEPADEDGPVADVERKTTHLVCFSSWKQVRPFGQTDCEPSGGLR
jgi:hypothetical protein